MTIPNINQFPKCDTARRTWLASLQPIAECRANDYVYNDEERFERRFGLRVD